MNHSPRLAAALALLAIAAAPSTTLASDLTVGSGSALALGTSNLDLGCADLAIAGALDVANGSIDAARHVVVQPGGSLDGGTGVLQVAGDWTNSGTFVASMGTIAFADGCGVTTATISSDSTFSTLSLTSSTAKTYQFAEGSTQTVSTHLHISGAPGNLLAIRSKTDGVQANIDLQGTQLVDWVDVKDNHAIGSSIGYPGNSVSSGNTTGWFAIAAVPALPLVGLLALMATMALGARRLLGPRPPNRVSAA